MANTTRQYNVSIFPCPETGDAPSAAIYMEVADGFEEFYREITERKAWGQAAGRIQIADMRWNRRRFL